MNPLPATCLTLVSRNPNLHRPRPCPFNLCNAADTATMAVMAASVSATFVIRLTVILLQADLRVRT
jgi:hypothetical protein